MLEMTMQEITVEELKAIELALLCQFDEICRQQGFNYTLCGGTLLGAVRHGGFIPWDDDIDVAMLRADYDKFVQFCTTHEVPFGMAFHECDPNYRILFGKIYNKDTILVEDMGNRWNSQYGVYIDIFPVDDLDENYSDALKKFNKRRFFRELLNAAQWKCFQKSKTYPWYGCRVCSGQ